MSGHQKAIDMLNKMWNDLVGSTGRTKHSINYWSIPRNWKGTRYLFGYTPWKTRNGDKTGYFALKYRELKNGNCKLVKSVRFGKRKTARARATKWYDEYYRQDN